MQRPDNHTMAEYNRAALITIDVQNETLDGGAFEIPGTSAILPHIGRLCRAFRRAARPIVHMIRIYTPDATDADRCRRTALLAGQHLLLKGSKGRRPADALLPDRTLRIDDDRLLGSGIQPIGPGEVLLFKPRWGAFYRTPLEAHLKEMDITTLIFTGCNFPNCPRASIYEASERDFRITAVVDALSGLTPCDVDWLAGIGVNTASTDEVLRLIEDTESEPKTGEISA